MESLRIKQLKNSVVFFKENTPLFIVKWQVADEMCNQFRAYTREKPPYKDSWEHKMLSLRPYEEGVDMLIHGNLVCRFPHKLVNVFLSSLVTVTRLTEENDKAEEIVYDNAIMKRSPFQLPFGLSDNKDIKKETLKEELEDIKNKDEIGKENNKLLTPFKYIKFFFVSLVSFIFNQKIIFYSVSLIIVFLFLRYIWRLIF